MRTEVEIGELEPHPRQAEDNGNSKAEETCKMKPSGLQRLTSFPHLGFRLEAAQTGKEGSSLNL